MKYRETEVTKYPKETRKRAERRISPVPHVCQY